MSDIDYFITMTGYLLYIGIVFKDDKYKIRKYFKLIDDPDLSCLYCLISDELERRNLKNVRKD